MSYLTAYGTQRIALARIAESIGVATRQRGSARMVAKPNNVIRADAAERILGRDLGSLGKGMNAAQFDQWLGERAATYRGEHGWLLQTAQMALREARNAQAEAVHLWGDMQSALKRATYGMVAPPSRKDRNKVLAAVKAHQQSALQWLEAARLAQDMHATELAMKAAGIDTSGADRATLQALEEQLQAQRRTAMANLPDMTKPQRTRRK